MQDFDPNRRRLLRMGLGAFGAGALISLDPFGILSRAEAEEFRPFCEHVTDSMRRELESIGFHIGLCNTCVQLQIGTIRSSLFDQSLVDTEPGIESPRMAQGPVFARSSVKSIADVIEHGSIAGSNMSIVEDPNSRRLVLHINEQPTTFIWKIIQDISGNRFLVYSKDGGLPWWQDPVGENIAGVVLGAHDMNGNWNREYRDRGKWCPVSTFANQVAQSGQLGLRANAVIMFG